ncbi:536_t:CDS:2 [Ambispora leptoticha]|uniref:536_t:CDS:1 n=1 Tax=Ambispora leptoticha TaxID=144679 RepID=A0A9N9G0K6_9GLOM|nr:536_t:CDS:2 [Ambispora leptoticha]
MDLNTSTDTIISNTQQGEPTEKSVIHENSNIDSNMEHVEDAFKMMDESFESLYMAPAHSHVNGLSLIPTQVDKASRISAGLVNTNIIDTKQVEDLGILNID